MNSFWLQQSLALANDTISLWSPNKCSYLYYYAPFSFVSFRLVLLLLSAARGSLCSTRRFSSSVARPRTGPTSSHSPLDRHSPVERGRQPADTPRVRLSRVCWSLLPLAASTRFLAFCGVTLQPNRWSPPARRRSNTSGHQTHTTDADRLGAREPQAYEGRTRRQRTPEQRQQRGDSALDSIRLRLSPPRRQTTTTE